MDELLDRLERGHRREFGATAINKIQLMMSTKGERGPEYTIMNEFPLGG
jgi:2'-5' RNA ligase